MTLKYLILVAECVLISMRALVGVRGCFTEEQFFDSFDRVSVLPSSSEISRFQYINNLHFTTLLRSKESVQQTNTTTSRGRVWLTTRGKGGWFHVHSSGDDFCTLFVRTLQ